MPTAADSSGLSRAQVRELKAEIHRHSNASAAERLLADSVRKGHEKLALHRYLVLHRLDAPRCAPYEDYCLGVAARLPGEVVHRIRRHVGWPVEAMDIAPGDAAGGPRIEPTGE